tara:strand:+ start:8989 stop:12009 length:3021 start_codon:yes stop_codon:yes gene_type:complete
MAAKKFKFISPGIYVNEVDESIISPTPPILGPVIIGRTRKGPAMRPIQVNSYLDFVETFGHPMAGLEDGDQWRRAYHAGPTYAAYAAKAWLSADVSPVTVVRTLGENHDSRSDSATMAGWESGYTTALDADTDSFGAAGAYGLWVFDSASCLGRDDATTLAGTGNPATGTLAAIWYCESGSVMMLKGTSRLGESNVTGTGVMIKSETTNNVFQVVLKNSTDGHLTTAEEKTFKFDFTNPGGQYIRDMFNTNPVMTNSDVVKSSEVTELKDKYWLGETFDRAVADTTTSTDSQFGVMLPLASGSVHWSHRKSGFVNPKTGWFISQDFGENTQFSPPDSVTKLFRFESLDYGTSGHKYKIAIEDLKASPNTTVPFGSFTVTLYPVGTPDKRAKHEALEKFTNCNLNPNSPNYIAARIGDKHLSWNYSLGKHLELGQYANRSKYIRVEMNPALEIDFNQASLPFGVTGPIRPNTAFYESGSAFFTDNWYQHTAEASLVPAETYASGGLLIGGRPQPTLELAASTYPYAAHIDVNEDSDDGTSKEAGMSAFSGTFPFPAVSLRSSSADGPGPGPGEDAYFGVSTTKSKNSNRPDHGITDYLRGLPFHDSVLGRFDELTGLPNGTEYSWVFSLDDIRINETGDGHHVSGSRADGSSLTAASSSYKSVLDKHDRFWTVFYGGHDGLDITEAEPFRNSQWTVGTTTKYTHYAWNSIDRAINTVADPDVLEYNLITAPGITNDDLTDRIIEVAEDRADALAIVDLADVFKPSTENTESYSNNLGTLTSVVSSLQTRDLDTSYACTYYPWVQIKDTRTDAMLWAPPSVVALGTMASSEASSELWFAPAGFNRGGLTEGSSGLPVVSVSERLTQKQRDKLYENNVNPIARFPSEGIVIFGQKTLQASQSALDRINVRRLLIYLKKEISRMSTEVLFDNNVPATWNRFIGMVNPFLSSVRSRFGVTDFKLVLDETTTTPDLIDRNIMYAKIFIKPARAIEFIALDFIITKSGASFED